MNAYLGDTYLRLERTSDAKDAYMAALKLDPKQVDALRGMVLAYALAEDETAAKAWLEKLRAADAESAEALDDLFE
jgi:cytochrome c-type biogenesis protein CcmH/NrfG